MRIVLVMLTLLALGGCVSDADTISTAITLPPTAQRPASFSWQQWTAAGNAVIRQKVPPSDQIETFLAYRTTLAAQVDAGKLTPDRFESLSRQKMVDLDIQTHGRAKRDADQGPKQLCESSLEGTDAKTVCY